MTRVVSESEHSSATVRSAGPVAAAACVCAGVLGAALAVENVLEERGVASSLVSGGLWERLVSLFGGDLELPMGGVPIAASVDFLHVLLLAVVFSLTTWFAGAFWIARRRRTSHPPVGMGRALAMWGWRGWRWWLVPGVWELLRILADSFELVGLHTFLILTTPFWLLTPVAGWVATFCELLRRPAAETPTSPGFVGRAFPCVPLTVWIGMLLYVVVFTAMNWQLSRGLLVPHGDSAMYEEHLWNVTHGKGFRSWLDDGRLFLGEHVQVVHLLLIPLHLAWPSLMMLDLCESAALASAALPVYWIARRHSGSHAAATCLALAWLLYAPAHYLDVSIDLKTFRPIAFGVPAMLFALDQMERGRFRTMCVFLLLALASKEDYAAVIAPLGVWMAVFPGRVRASSNTIGSSDGRGRPSYGDVDDATGASAGVNVAPVDSPRPSRWLGVCVAVFATAYLVAVVVWIIPYFRGGDVHYARYFGELGRSPADIVRTAIDNPALVAARVFSVRSLIYATALLVPLGLIPLLSPARLAVASPLFAMLCLLQLGAGNGGGGEFLIPFHHFHAPVVPIIFWAAAAGLGASFRFGSSMFRARFACLAALATGLVLSCSPLSVSFWDKDAGGAYWRTRYIPGRRAELFEKVQAAVPLDARVFSTDFVHPRFTHHKRSYDYSAYPRGSDAELTNPVAGETYYIVIDVRHPYSTIKTPADVREYREHPDEWELLDLDVDGYFIVLRRTGFQPVRATRRMREAEKSVARGGPG